MTKQITTTAGAGGNRATLVMPAWLRRLDTLPERATDKALQTSRDFLRDETRRNAQKGGMRGLRVRSGRLLRSIRTYLKATPKGGELSLGMAFYGWVNDRGATIVPVRAPALKFFVPGFGWRNSQKVVLPERRWARDAIDETRKRYPRFLSQALRQAKAGTL